MTKFPPRRELLSPIAEWLERNDGHPGVYREPPKNEAVAGRAPAPDGVYRSSNISQIVHVQPGRYRWRVVAAAVGAIDQLATEFVENSLSLAKDCSRGRLCRKLVPELSRYPASCAISVPQRTFIKLLLAFNN